MFVYKIFFESLFSISLGIHLGVELLGHREILRLIFWATAKLFSTLIVPFYIPTSNVQGFPFLHILGSTFIFCFFFNVILMSIEQYHFPSD